MSFSRTAGITIVPLLSRIVLGAAFLLSGWYYCFSDTVFTPDELDRIDAVQAETARTGASIQLVSFLGDGDEAADEADPAHTTDPHARRAVYRIALDLQSWGIEKGSVPLAWGIAVLEIVAGALTLVGLFTRLWTLLLAVLIAAAFVMTSVQQHGLFDMSPFTWRADSATYFQLFFQAAGFVLALGLLLTGPGVLAVDNMVFGKSQPAGGGSPAASGA